MQAVVCFDLAARDEDYTLNDLDFAHNAAMVATLRLVSSTLSLQAYLYMESYSKAIESFETSLEIDTTNSASKAQLDLLSTFLQYLEHGLRARVLHSDAKSNI